ncbi:Chemotaxis protein CheX [Gammaproteobacteria bacterium]
MNTENCLVSKVLVLDNSAEHFELIKGFCEMNHLVGLRVRKDQLMSVLDSNIDLGAVFYSENFGDTPEDTTDIAVKIKSLRSELPIIIRRETQDTLDDIPEPVRSVYCAAYVADNMNVLHKVMDEYLFSLVYPSALVRGIGEITQSVLAGQFKNRTVSMETPHLVRDRILFGDVISMIPLESNWCRGYMVMQTQEDSVVESLTRDSSCEAVTNFREVNSLLVETTNLVWGTFKYRYIGAVVTSCDQIQIPILFNYKHKYISFGTENPQLCFIYTLTDENTGHAIRVSQRFIFNLHWSPDDFKDLVQDEEQVVASGELEFF